MPREGGGVGMLRHQQHEDTDDIERAAQVVWVDAWPGLGLGLGSGLGVRG